MTATTIEKAEKYLECFLPGTYSLDRAQKHTELIEAILAKHYIVFNHEDLIELKKACCDVTDNLDRSIGLPLDKRFSTKDYVEDLIKVLESKLIDTIKDQYTDSDKAFLATLYHDIGNENFVFAAAHRAERRGYELEKVSVYKILLNYMLALSKHSKHNFSAKVTGWRYATQMQRHKEYFEYTNIEQSISMLMRAMSFEIIQRDADAAQVINDDLPKLYECIQNIVRTMLEGLITKRAILIIGFLFYDECIPLCAINHDGSIAIIKSLTYSWDNNHKQAPIRGADSLEFIEKVKNFEI